MSRILYLQNKSYYFGIILIALYRVKACELYNYTIAEQEQNNVSLLFLEFSFPLVFASPFLKFTNHCFDQCFLLQTIPIYIPNRVFCRMVNWYTYVGVFYTTNINNFLEKGNFMKPKKMICWMQWIAGSINA